MRNISTSLLALMAVCFGTATACLPTTVHAQIGDGYWQFSNPKPIGMTMFEISMATNDLGVAVGDRGGIARTTDGGNTWQFMSYTFPNAAGTARVITTFNDIDFATATVGYAVGNSGCVVKTVDGGLNWSFVNTPFYAGATAVNTVFFLDANTGYIAGSPVSGNTSIYKTTDGGSTWTRESGLPVENVTIQKVKFVNANLGYAVGNSGLVWKYANGSWKSFTFNTTLFPNSGNTNQAAAQNLRSIGIITDHTIMVGSQNNSLLVRIETTAEPVTSANYTVINNNAANYGPLVGLGLGSFLIRNMDEIRNNDLTDATLLLAVPGTNAVNYSMVLLGTNQGQDWTVQKVYGDNPDAAGLSFNTVEVAPGGRIVAVGTNGIMADSVTGGSWRKPFKLYKNESTTNPGGITEMAFADADYGAGGGLFGTFLVTIDGGNTWTNQSFGNNYVNDVESIAYPDKDHLYVGNRSGLFSVSFDHGETFDLFYTDGKAGSIYDMHFLDKNKGWITVSRGFTNETTYEQLILRTNDGGLTWDSSKNLPQGNGGLRVETIRFSAANPLVGYVAGSSGRIYKTTDGGINWTNVSNLDVAYTGTFYSLAVPHPDTVYAAGSSGRVVRSFNGGSNWTTVSTTDISGLLGKVLAYDPRQVLVFGPGVVWTSTDYGNSWTPYYYPVAGSAYPSGAFAPMKDCNIGVCLKVYAGAGGRGTILKFDADRILPVRFSQLSGSYTQGGNQLFWTAYTQQEVRHFEVEYASNGRDFRTVSEKIATTGFSSGSYAWLHAGQPSGRHYYRIRATEKNGGIHYTNILALDNRIQHGWKCITQGNSLVVNHTQVARGMVSINVINAAGQVIAAKQWHHQGGAFNDMLWLPPQAHGVHLVRINSSNGVQSFKVFVR